MFCIYTKYIFVSGGGGCYTEMLSLQVYITQS